MKEFQKKLNLPQTGKLDSKTIENLFKMIFVLQPKSLTDKTQSEIGESRYAKPFSSSLPTSQLLPIKAYYDYSIKIISPQENETWYAGKVYSIRWEFQSPIDSIMMFEAPRHETPTQTSTKLILPPQGGESNSSILPQEISTPIYPPIYPNIPVQKLYLYLISDNGYERNIGGVSIFKTSFNWFIPEDIPSGEYRIRISTSPYYGIIEKYYDLDIKHYGASLKDNKPYLENNVEDYYSVGAYYDSPKFKIISKEKTSFKGGTIILDELPGSPEVSCKLPEMKRGDKRNEVYLLQLVLAIENYYPERVFSGFFGRLTEGAVKRFQRLNNLSVDGIVSGKTLEILQSLVNKNYEECTEDTIGQKPIIDKISPNPLVLEQIKDTEGRVIIYGANFTDNNIVRFKLVDSYSKKGIPGTFDIIAIADKKSPYGKFSNNLELKFRLDSISSCSIPKNIYDIIKCSKIDVFNNIEDFSGKYEILVINGYGQESEPFKFEIIKDEVNNRTSKYRFILNLSDVYYSKERTSYWENYETYLSTSLYCNNLLRNTEKFYFRISSLTKMIFEIFIPTDCKNQLVSFKVPYFLSKIKTPVFSNLTSYDDEVSLINGDTNNDDIINDSDILNILFNINQNILEKYGIRYDLNLDERIDDQDLQIVLKNFGKKGDSNNISILPVVPIRLNSIESYEIYYGDKVIIKGDGFKSAQKLVIGIKESSANNIDGYLTNFQILDDNTIEISSFPSQTNMCYSFDPIEPICLGLMVIQPGNYTLIILTDDNRNSNEVTVRILGER